MPFSAGFYFSWGNIDGHPAGAGYNFSQEAYAETPGAQLSADIPTNQDAAYVELGVNWRIPTIDDFQELIDGCDAVKTSINDMQGYLFTSKNNGRSIFIPLVGRYQGTTLNYRGTSGYYWARDYQNSTQAISLHLSGQSLDLSTLYGRSSGFSIRPVFNPNT